MDHERALRLGVRTEESELLIDLAGELDLSTAPQLWAAIDEAIAAGHDRLVLDLAELTFVDSTGLGVFVRAAKELRAVGGEVSLRSPGERVTKLLQITKLEDVFEIR
jgi:anti-sigma B factor antagonist